MPDARYYVRSRGKITGPFAVDTLVKLVERGMIKRFDEVSSDRVVWARAEEYDELYPAPPSPAPLAASVCAAPEPAPLAAAAAISAPAAESDGRYYYQQEGAVTVGPVPVTVLKALAENGTLRPSDLVWTEGAQTAWQASQLTQLAPVFLGRSRTRENVSGNSYSAPSPSRPASAARLRRSLQNTNAGVLICAIVASILLLLSLHLPVGAAFDGTILGWWTVLRGPGRVPDAAVVLVVMVILISLTATAVLILSPVLRGLPRALTLMAIGGLGILNCVASLFTSPSASLSMLLFSLFYLVPASAGFLAALGRSRRLSGGEGGKTLQGVMSGILGLCTLVLSIVLIPVLIRLSNYGGLFVGLVLLVIALLVLLAAAVLGFIGLKPSFSGGLHLAMQIAARTGNAVLISACVLAILDVAGFVGWFSAALDAPRHWNDSALGSNAHLLLVLLGFRALVILLYYPLIMSLGFEDYAATTLVAPALRAAGRR